MSGDSLAKLSAEHARLRLEFLRTELDLSHALVSVAQTERNLGHLENANRSLAHAEEGYQTVVRFLAKPDYLSDEQVVDLRARLADLRGALDSLR